MLPRPMLRTLTILAALAAANLACENRVGDPCLQTIDCGVDGRLMCDVSNLQNSTDKDGKGGECTLENCSYGACDNGSVCIQVYGTSIGASQPCDPLNEDRVDQGQVVRDDCQTNEICIPEGFCVDEQRASTSCRVECDDDDDCRPDYRCKSTGEGFYVAPDPVDPTRVISAKICVPSTT